ncbi:MAG: hypothetical protein AAF622_05545, partial [Cyanobacteria bacterium P01_C01_bin.147]
GDDYAIGSPYCSPILSEVSGAASLLNAAGINGYGRLRLWLVPQGGTLCRRASGLTDSTSQFHRRLVSQPPLIAPVTDEGYDNRQVFEI